MILRLEVKCGYLAPCMQLYVLCVVGAERYIVSGRLRYLSHDFIVIGLKLLDGFVYRCFFFFYPCQFVECRLLFIGGQFWY